MWRGGENLRVASAAGIDGIEGLGEMGGKGASLSIKSVLDTAGPAPDSAGGRAANPCKSHRKRAGPRHRKVRRGVDGVKPLDQGDTPLQQAAGRGMVCQGSIPTDEVVFEIGIVGLGEHEQEPSDLPFRLGKDHIRFGLVWFDSPAY